MIPPRDTDPLGQYAEELFVRAGVAGAIARKRQRGEVVEDLGRLREGLAHGDIDGGVVYAASAASLAPAGHAVWLGVGEELRDRIVFTIGALARDGAERPSAERFVSFMTGDGGQNILREAGFLPRLGVTSTPEAVDTGGYH